MKRLTTKALALIAPLWFGFILSSIDSDCLGRFADCSAPPSTKAHRDSQQTTTIHERPMVALVVLSWGRLL